MRDLTLSLRAVRLCSERRSRAAPLRASCSVRIFGRLAAYLRLPGFDTLYRNDYADDELARIAAEDERVLLARDRGLLKRSVVTHGYYRRATRPRDQPPEVMRRFPVRNIRRQDVQQPGAQQLATDCVASPAPAARTPLTPNTRTLAA